MSGQKEGRKEGRKEETSYDYFPITKTAQFNKIPTVCVCKVPYRRKKKGGKQKLDRCL